MRRAAVSLLLVLTRFASGEDVLGEGGLASAFSEGLQKQTLQKLRETGESITIMVCGESGLGKTSLLSSLFHTELVWPSSKPGQPTPKISEQNVVFDLEGMPFSARLIDTPGYGDVDLVRDFNLVIHRLDAGFRQSLMQERRIQRQPNYDAARQTKQLGTVDVALYFFAPHRCKRADIAFLRRMAGKVRRSRRRRREHVAARTSRALPPRAVRHSRASA